MVFEHIRRPETDFQSNGPLITLAICDSVRSLDQSPAKTVKTVDESSSRVRKQTNKKPAIFIFWITLIPPFLKKTPPSPSPRREGTNAVSSPSAGKLYFLNCLLPSSSWWQQAFRTRCVPGCRVRKVR